MNDAKSGVIVFLFAMVPYLLVTWGYTTFTDGNAKTFWTALGVLLGTRLFFGLIEMLGSVLTWRLYCKRIAVRKAVEFLRANNFPMREYQQDDVLAYLLRIYDGGEYPQSVKSRAKEIERALEFLEEVSFLPAARMQSAWEAALNIYAPRESALKVLM